MVGSGGRDVVDVSLMEHELSHQCVGISVVQASACRQLRYIWNSSRKLQLSPRDHPRKATNFGHHDQVAPVLPPTSHNHQTLCLTSTKNGKFDRSISRLLQLLCDDNTTIFSIRRIPRKSTRSLDGPGPNINRESRLQRGLGQVTKRIIATGIAYCLLFLVCSAS